MPEIHVFFNIQRRAIDAIIEGPVDSAMMGHDGGSTPELRSGSGQTPHAARTHHEGASLNDHSRVQRHERYESTPKALPGGGTPASAVDAAKTMSGAHERRDNAMVRQYLATGGHGMDPADTSWCAAFVGASLRKAGVQDVPVGKGGNVATSYEKWGEQVNPKEGIKKGDVLVETRGLGPGATGGHVGLLTGRVNDGKAEMISGNYSNKVKTSWERVGGSNMVRRATAKELPHEPANSEPEKPKTEGE
jgi:uncharacterized protein (TIGR02594 family)